MPVSKGAFAYNKGNSIKRHAEFHKDSYFIFHTDIKNFFPSITSEHLISVLSDNHSLIEEAGLWFDDLFDVISSICFRHNHLCIGTVSSPAICNIIMYFLMNTLRIIAAVVIGSIQDTLMIFIFPHKNTCLALCEARLMKS